MKKEYKSTPIRLVEFFETSRDKWKERSLKYQKEKRALQIQVRDISRSKGKWKDECSRLRIENNKLRGKEKKTKELLQKILSQ
jgi:hypothetical protein